MSKINRTVLHESVATINYFKDGGTVRSRNDLFVHDNLLYQWQGDLPAQVPVNSTPNSSPNWLLIGIGGREVLVDSTYKLKELDTPAGTLVRTLGYHYKGGIGAGTYLVVPEDTYQGAPDNLGDFKLGNGNVAVLVITGDVCVSQFGAHSNDAFDSSASVQSAIYKASKLGKSIIIDTNCTLNSTINLISSTTIKAYSAKIKVGASAGTLFNAASSTRGIESVSILGGEWTEQSPYNNGSVTFCKMQGSYGSGEGTHVYINRFNFQHIKAYNFKWFIESDWGRSWNATECFVYGSNGFRIQHKNVECNITNCIVFGTRAEDASTRGISVGEGISHAGEGCYPEGIKIHNCTIDNFGRALSVHEILDLSVTDNWLGASIDRSKHCLAFEKDSGNFMRGLHFSHNTYFGGKIEFITHAAPPTLVALQMTDETYLTAQTIEIGRSWHDVTLSGWDINSGSSTPSVGIVCRGDNKDWVFRDITFRGEYSGLIQIYTNQSSGCIIDGVYCNKFVQDPFYVQSAVSISNSISGKPVEGSYANGGQVVMFKKLSTATQGAVLAELSTAGYKVGSLVEVRVSGTFNSNTTSGAMKIVDTSGCLVPFKSGTGWDSAYIELANTPNRVDASVLFRCVKQGVSTVQVQAYANTITPSAHACVSVQYV